LDGHTILSRRLAGRGHYPAVEVLESISRLMNDIAGDEHRAAAQIVRELLSAYRDHEDLISIGAYRAGANPTVDIAMAMLPELQRFLRQNIQERSSVESARDDLLKLTQKIAVIRQNGSAAALAAQQAR
jgi:flagellar biosynthesis/type III secretory pathway ATPase